jgi:hypothetical protein
VDGTTEIPPIDDGDPIDDPDDTDPTDDSDDTPDESIDDERDTEADEIAPEERGELPRGALEQVRWPHETGISISREDSSSEELLQEARRNSSIHSEREAAEGRFSIVRSQQMMQALDEIRQEMAEDAALAAGERETIVSSAEKVAVAFSAGLLGILLRGSSLAAVALSSLPIWRRVDPLAILALSDEERRKREEELRAAQEKEDSSEEAVGRLLD